MKNNLLLDFTVDKTTNTVFVNRAFAADLALVWDAFTKQEILDQWWAPKPWISKTKYMKFEVGGRRFYAMVSPEGQEYWSIQDFRAISPMTNFKFVSAFTDKDENKNTEFPGSNWNLDFSETNEVTTVRITIKHKTLSGLEQHIQMGFKEGFTMTLNDLEQLLVNLTNIKILVSHRPTPSCFAFIGAFDLQKQSDAKYRDSTRNVQHAKPLAAKWIIPKTILRTTRNPVSCFSLLVQTFPG